MRQNVAILVALFLVLTLGLWGQYDLSPERFRGAFPSVIYEVMMLFALEGDWTLRIDLPWQLELARFLAPLASVVGILIVLTRGAWVGLTNKFIRFWSNHVVLVGLSERGMQFAQSCRQGHSVVAIERDPNNPFIARARNAGIPVIVGDALVTEVLRDSHVEHARHVVTFCDNDGDSVEIALKIQSFLIARNPRRDTKLRLHLHVNATRVSSRLEHYAKFYDQKTTDVNFFSEHELTARLLLKKYPPDMFAHIFRQQQVHIAIFGFDSLGEHILIEAVRVCHYRTEQKTRFTIFDCNVHDKTQQLFSLHPSLNALCDIELVDLPFLLPLQLSTVATEKLQSVTEHVICMQRDDQNLELALMLRSALLERRSCNAPINVRIQRSVGLAKLLEADENNPEVPDGIFPFGMLDEVLYHENILADRMDALAQAMHEEYLNRRNQVGVDERLYASLQTWNELPEPLRKSSRLQADHLDAKLRAIRCRYSDTPLTTPFAFTRAEAETTARMEHARWTTNKIYEGWKSGTERIEGARINPLNVPWEELDTEEQEAQVVAILALPDMIASHFQGHFERELYIGVTDHMSQGLQLDVKKLHAAISQVLTEIVAQNPGCRYILVSPLAEGTDQIIAQIAVEEFQMVLHVAMPLPYELYQTDFTSSVSREEFKLLVGKSELYYEMPTMFGTTETLASHISGEPNPLRDRQYALTAAYIAQSCHEMIAVYDGTPGEEVEDSIDVAEWRDHGVPEDYRFPFVFCSQPERRPTRVIHTGA
ncbi:MAG: hypothetical protein ACI82A_002972 [Candidatus Azotimanducaceae bacterium]|jgi:hypothetical protein